MPINYSWLWQEFVAIGADIWLIRLSQTGPDCSGPVRSPM